MAGPDAQARGAITRGCVYSPGSLSYQSSVGRSTLSITKTSTGARADSSFRPSCSCSAVKIVGGSPTTEVAPTSRPSAEDSRSKSNNPVRPVRSSTERPTCCGRMAASSAIELPPPRKLRPLVDTRHVGRPSACGGRGAPAPRPARSAAQSSVDGVSRGPSYPTVRARRNA